LDGGTLLSFFINIIVSFNFEVGYSSYRDSLHKKYEAEWTDMAKN
jgi:hypothetical protein